MAMVQSLLQNFGINHTIFLMFGIFVGTYAVLRFLALGKLSETIVERSKRTEGREHAAIESQHELVEIEGKLSAEMKTIQAEAGELFVSIKTKAQAEQAVLIKSARDRASSEVKAARDEVESAFRDELVKARKEVPEIAHQILARLLSAPVKNTATAASLMRSELRDG